MAIADTWMHPGDDAPAVRTWAVPNSGPVTIEAHFRDDDGACGDGVSIGIWLNRPSIPGVLPLMSTGLANGDTQGFIWNASVNVRAGDYLGFMVGRGPGNTACDRTHVNIRLSSRERIQLWQTHIDEGQVAPTEYEAMLEVNAGDFIEVEVDGGEGNNHFDGTYVDLNLVLR